MELIGQRQTLATVPGERHGTHCIAGWMGPVTILDVCGKCPLLPAFNPQTSSP